jgi:hypothetical protein
MMTLSIRPDISREKKYKKDGASINLKEVKILNGYNKKALASRGNLSQED